MSGPTTASCTIHVAVSVIRTGCLTADQQWSRTVHISKSRWLGLLACVAVITASVPAAAQQQKPNILFIMGDDIGWMQPRIYHRGLMVGETPNIDRIGNEGAIFMESFRCAADTCR